MQNIDLISFSVFGRMFCMIVWLLIPPNQCSVGHELPSSLSSLSASLRLVGPANRGSSRTGHHSILSLMQWIGIILVARCVVGCWRSPSRQNIRLAKWEVHASNKAIGYRAIKWPAFSKHLTLRWEQMPLLPSFFTCSEARRSMDHNWPLLQSSQESIYRPGKHGI